MSSSNRTSSKGGKGTKADKGHKTDKSDTGKASGDKQSKDASKIQNSKSDDNLKEMVKQVIEMSQRSEEEVCLALHECNFDVNQAINMLFETIGPGEWSVKKKKSRQPSGSKQEKTEDQSGGGGADEWNDNPPASNNTGSGGNAGDKERGRSKSGGPARVHGRHNDSRGWRGREKQENERNLEEGGGRDHQRERRGRPAGGPNRGAGGRGGRGGGRAGGRYPPRGGSRSNTYNKPIDTWDNSNTWDNSTATKAAEESWDDFPGTDEWSTEEYTGSLADTKVFTPSTQTASGIDSEPSHHPGGPLDAASQQLGQTLQINQGAGQLSQSPVPPMGTLNAAQTQYLNQLQQQNSDKYGGQTFQSQAGSQVYNSATVTSQAYNVASSQPYNSGGSSTASQGYNASGAGGQVYNSNQQYGSSPGQTNTYANSTYPAVNSYGSTTEQAPSQQPARTKTQRARVPPPSKIPASAVEMPGDLNSSIGYLDVQFGAMDFMSDSSSFDGSATEQNKYQVSGSAATLDSTGTATVQSSSQQPANMDLSGSNQNSNLDVYSAKSNTQNSISSTLNQNLTNTDSIPQTSEHLSGTYNTAPRSTSGSTGSQSAAPSALDINKQGDSHTYSQSSTYNSYQSKNTYNSSAYSSAQTTASSYQGNSSYVNSQAGSYNPPSANTYQNSYSSATSYQSGGNQNAFPSITQANSYPSGNQTYAQNTSQSVYGANAGLNSSSYGGNTSTSQYNNYTSSNKLVKDNAYDSSNSVSTTQASTTNVTSSTTPLSLAQTSVSVSKTTTTTLAKNSSGMVSNMPPGVAPVMSTPYNMVQVPYFQQPVYSYEDMQLLQQRLPHMTTPYYDMSYQTPTTLAAVRDATLGNVGYSISDGRFTRGDNNASPVPSTLSQQTSTLTQGHQAQPILAGTGPPYFFAPFNTIPNYPFYTQLPAAANTHGTNNSTQYAKPGTYGTGYSSYDALNQTQDYNKGAYVGNTQAQKGAAGNASSTGSAANDLSAMYGKSHTALGKVNSYEKQGFHSGTPPPFTGALHGSQNAALAPSGTGYAPQVYIPTMAPQHHSTQLMHQPLHQMDVRYQGRRVDSGNTGAQRSQTSTQGKTGGKQYAGSYWNQA